VCAIWPTEQLSRYSGGVIDRSSLTSLRVVNDDNVRQIIDLSVSTDQENLVAPNAVSLAEAFATTMVWVRAVYADDTPVGFAMLSDNEEKPRYYLWRFMIDSEYQGMGFGGQAMALIHDYVRSRPGGTKVYLSYVPQAGGPEMFYKALGYQDTGVENGGELEAVLTL
jgi:diamine N-acetyltransferase